MDEVLETRHAFLCRPRRERTFIRKRLSVAGARSTIQHQRQTPGHTPDGKPRKSDPTLANGNYRYFESACFMYGLPEIFPLKAIVTQGGNVKNYFCTVFTRVPSFLEIPGILCA